MAVDHAFDVAHTALLAMDCQTGIVSIYAKPEEEFLNRAATVLHAARDAAIAVVHVRVGFRPGLPEVSSRNKLFANIKASPQHQELFAGALGAVRPAHACDSDYQLVVISDCCADLDAGLHEVLLTRLFPQRAAVVTAGELVRALQSI